MNFNIFNSIIFAGVIQGLVFGAVVFLSKKYKSKSVYFLTTLIILYSFNNLQYYFVDIELINYEELFKSFYFPWVEFTSPLLYFYVVTYLFPEKKINPKSKWLFSLFGLHFIISSTYKILVRVESKTDGLEKLVAYLRYYVAYYAELVTALFGIVVLVILFNTINNYKKEYKEFQQSHVRLKLNWLKAILYVLLILTILNVTLVATDMNVFEDISYYPVWLLVTIVIYWLGHIGIYKYGIVEQRKQIRKKQLAKGSNIEKGKTKHIIIERLKQYLENEKRFLDASLTLEKTAEALELSQGHLSKIINTELGVSFKDYINTLRVEEAKLYLIDTNFSNYTLVAIGLEAGFNSKSAFNTSFKKITGQTPSQYQKRHIN
ncbi:MAG: AraC family transcriptional regulator [Flavobacteriaceae bacterium]|nr:AraC family transcriptional regulator [Flavobacteriaceae bacterium]